MYVGLSLGAVGGVQVLPCVIDVGTDNTVLRRDPLYCGLDQPRLTGKAYYDVVDEVRGFGGGGLCCDVGGGVNRCAGGWVRSRWGRRGMGAQVDGCEGGEARTV